MENIQYIKNAQGQAEYVILPMADYQALLNRLDDEEEWEAIPVESDEFDDVTIPNEIVWIMAERDVNSLGAWRIYRGLSQADVATQTGLTQGAISQMERRESKPQKRTREKFAKIYNCEPEQLAI